MTKKAYNLEFAERLRRIMIKKGHISQTSACGVSPTALSRGIGCFMEMALRYLDGRSIPTPEVTLKIAKWLEVEPAYLLFGEQETIRKCANQIIIDKEIISYTFKRIIPLIKKSENESEIIDFFNSLLSDVSLINLENTELKKVIDLALKSTSFFNEKSSNGREKDGSIQASCQAAS